MRGVRRREGCEGEGQERMRGVMGEESVKGEGVRGEVVRRRERCNG